MIQIRKPEDHGIFKLTHYSCWVACDKCGKTRCIANGNNAEFVTRSKQMASLARIFWTCAPRQYCELCACGVPIQEILRAESLASEDYDAWILSKPAEQRERLEFIIEGNRKIKRTYAQH